MEDSDYLDVDGRQLTILLTIRQAGSLSGAARMLDMNQSTVSYWLDLLRKRLGDPLFVRAGNGVEPTERARALLGPARDALCQLEALGAREDYAPETDGGTLRLAATAIERDLLIAPLVRQALSVAPGLSFEILPSGSTFQVIDRLRQDTVDFALTPEITEPADWLLRRALIRIEDAV